MKLANILKLSIIILALGVVPALAVDATEANRILAEEILPTVHVEFHDGDKSIQGNSTEAVRIHTQKYIGLEGFLEPDPNSSYIEFSGGSVPTETVVTIIFPTTFVRSSTMADADGRWSINVPVDQLSAGYHQAMIQTIYEGVRSDETLIAEFNIDAKESLSNSTWVFLFSSVLAIVCLLFAITLQLHHNMRGFSSDPLM